MKRTAKGNYGYIAAKRRQVAIMTTILFGIALALFITGYVTTGTRKNLLTVVAVLGCLPACKSLVNMIMFFRAKGCSEKARKAIMHWEEGLAGMYDMYFTSYQKNFAVSHMAVKGKVVLGYAESGRCDIKACEEHLRTMLKQAGFKDMAVKISDDLDKYIGQLQNLNDAKEDHDPEKDDEVRAAFYDVSL